MQALAGFVINKEHAHNSAACTCNTSRTRYKLRHCSFGCILVSKSRRNCATKLADRPLPCKLANHVHPLRSRHYCQGNGSGRKGCLSQSMTVARQVASSPASPPRSLLVRAMTLLGNLPNLPCRLQKAVCKDAIPHQDNTCSSAAAAPLKHLRSQAVVTAEPKQALPRPGPCSRNVILRVLLPMDAAFHAFHGIHCRLEAVCSHALSTLLQMLWVWLALESSAPASQSSDGFWTLTLET